MHTAVDTCGYADWEDLERVAAATDLFLCDVKHMDADRHRELAGASNERILENLRRLDNEGRPLWIRYPVIPGLDDAADDVAALGEFVSHLKAVEAVHLLPLHRGGERKLDRLGKTSWLASADVDPMSAAEIAGAILRSMLCVPVQIGG
ncbi:radical SAM protein [Candidatus Bipolaricaulota bacterium]|nr:radical SAM protein [Candidatus Bipolaricaulota bacterium]